MDDFTITAEEIRRMMQEYEENRRATEARLREEWARGARRAGYVSAPSFSESRRYNERDYRMPFMYSELQEIVLGGLNIQSSFKSKEDAIPSVTVTVSEMPETLIERRIKDVKKLINHSKDHLSKAKYNKELNELQSELSKRRKVAKREIARSEHALDDFLGAFAVS